MQDKVRLAARGPRSEHWNSCGWNILSHQHCRLQRDGNDICGCPPLHLKTPVWQHAWYTKVKEQAQFCHAWQRKEYEHSMAIRRVSSNLQRESAGVLAQRGHRRPSPSHSSKPIDCCSCSTCILQDDSFRVWRPALNGYLLMSSLPYFGSFYVEGVGISSRSSYRNSSVMVIFWCPRYLHFSS